MVKSVFGAKSGEGADVHLVRAGTGLRRCRVAEGFGVTDPAQTDGTPARSAAPLAGPIRGRFEVRATASDHFAWVRTRLSVERTLMSWVRTAVSLIGFGFAIVQFFDRMQQMSRVNPARFPDAPRYLGLSLILCGILDLAVSIWEYYWTLHYLWGGDFTPIAGMTKEGRQTPIVAVAGILILIGMFAFFAVLLRLV